MTAPAAPATDSSSNGDATSASPAYRMGMRLGRKTAMGCSITSLLLLALTPVSLAVFLAGTSLVQADADDHLLRWVTGASASLSAAFLAIGLLSLARERGWLAPRHALAAAITSVISGVIGAVANIAMTFSYDAKNLGAPEPLLGHLDMTLNRASWVVLAAAVAIAVSGLTVTRDCAPSPGSQWARCWHRQSGSPSHSSGCTPWPLRWCSWSSRPLIRSRHGHRPRQRRGPQHRGSRQRRGP